MKGTPESLSSSGRDISQDVEKTSLVVRQEWENWMNMVVVAIFAW